MYKKLFGLDWLLLLLSIGLATYIYYSPGIVVGHMDLKGTINGSGTKGTIFVLPAIALFVFIVFNVFEKYPSFLVKGEMGTDRKTRQRILFYWRLLKMLCLFAVNAILIATCFPKSNILLPAIIALFLVYNIGFLSKTQQKP